MSASIETIIEGVAKEVRFRVEAFARKDRRQRDYREGFEEGQISGLKKALEILEGINELEIQKQRQAVTLAGRWESEGGLKWVEAYTDGTWESDMGEGNPGINHISSMNSALGYVTQVHRQHGINMQRVR